MTARLLAGSPGAPATTTRWHPTPSRRFRFARRLALTASALSRATGYGAGTTIGGRVLLWIDPDGLRVAARGRTAAVVTGTNGKTTTRTLLVAALSRRGPVVSNRGGANLRAGVGMALARDLSAPTAVLEVDEYVVEPVVAETTADVVVLLNLSRDQLDRVAEVSSVAARWRTMLGSARIGTVVANADDPHVVWAAADAPRVVWVAPCSRWLGDAATCPACGEPLDMDPVDWHCRCGLRRPHPAWRVEAGSLVAPDGRRHPLHLQLPGAVNETNAAFAAAAATCLGLPLQDSLDAFEGVATVEGRYDVVSYRGREVRVLLAKNPAGWTETIGMVRPPPATLVLSVNARTADGRDPAWLWDVPFERWAGRPVIVTGERALDLLVRLKYAGVAARHVPRLRDAMLAGDRRCPTEVVANYTTFRQLLRLLHDG